MANKLNFVATYNSWSEKLKRKEKNNDIAMQKAIGSEFDAIGLMEKDLLIQYGLKASDYLIDAGCGSGRLAIPLSEHLPNIKYLGTDIVKDFLEYAETKTNNSNFNFKLTNGFVIPESDNQADIVCFFSVFTHLLHEETYNYLIEAKRVLKPNGKIIFSFLEFFIPCHWNVFENDYKNLSFDKPLNMFISRDAINAWAMNLGLKLEGIYDGDKPHIKLNSPVILENGQIMNDYGNLGQSVCILQK